jgi:hypothetical protein
MAQTTTFLRECDVVVSLDDADGNVCDISGSANEVSVELSERTEVLYKFGSDYPSRFSLGRDVIISLLVVFTTTTDEGADILKNWAFASSFAARTCSVYIPDATAGSDMISGEFVLETCSLGGSAASGDPMIVRAVLAAHGEITLSTVA